MMALPGRVHRREGQRFLDWNRHSCDKLQLTQPEMTLPPSPATRFGLLIIVILLAGTPAVSTWAESSGPPRVFMLDGKFMQSARERLRNGDTNLMPALRQLESDADHALSAGPFAIVNKEAVPPSGDKHDYMSMAPYFWPNPDTSNGLPYIRRDGERNPEISNDPDHRVMDEMAGTVETLALGYYFTGKEAYAAKATQLLRTWYMDPATRMNCNLQFAQAVRGLNTGRGTGVIESRSLPRVVDAVGLLAGSKAWTDADQRSMQDWFDQYLKWMLESKNGRAEGDAKNNHGSHYDVQVVSFALFVGKRELASNIVWTARTKRIDLQIQADGSEPLELARTKSWGYSIFNLGALMSLASLGDELGVDLWNYRNPKGAGIRTALDYLLPYAVDGKQWPHQQIHGFQGDALYPWIRRASLKYKDAALRKALTHLPPVDPASRVNLLSPKLNPGDLVEE